MYIEKKPNEKTKTTNLRTCPMLGHLYIEIYTNTYTQTDQWFL